MPGDLNTTSYALLALLAIRPWTTYELATQMDRSLRWFWPRAASVLYTEPKKLVRLGLATASREFTGRRPRTVYAITDAGREELVSWVRELVSTPEPELRRFEAGLSVMPVLPPDEVTALLRQRLDHLEAGIAQARSELDGHRAEVPRLFLVEVEYDLALREAEAAWVRALLDDLTSGAFPGLDEWAEFHRTGERSKP
jgi:DNA-binding PadR family transcriptional regulator